MRFEVLRVFEQVIQPYKANIRKVAVIGGSESEPELTYISAIPDVQIKFLGVEKMPQDLGDFISLDLNERTSVNQEFDLILCSQVLEHIWNHSQAFENFYRLLNPDGLIWIGCPASNIAHGSPDYFSAGFTPDYISENLKSRKFEILHQQSIGSKRYYFLTHALQIWGSEKMHRYPVFFGFSKYYPREFLLRFYAFFLSKKVRYDLKFATETIVFARKLGL
jgi:SAM-dependent methyltransferase